MEKRISSSNFIGNDKIITRAPLLIKVGTEGPAKSLAISEKVRPLELGPSEPGEDARHEISQKKYGKAAGPKGITPGLEFIAPAETGHGITPGHKTRFGPE